LRHSLQRREPDRPSPPPVRFSPPGDARTMLELVTVGFYRFWLATDMRRQFVSSTSVEGMRRNIPHGKGAVDRFLFALAFSFRSTSSILSSVSKRSGCGHSRAFLWFSSSTSSPIRHLPRPPLSADAHGLARGALLDGGSGSTMLGARACGASLSC